MALTPAQWSGGYSRRTSLEISNTGGLMTAVVRWKVVMGKIVSAAAFGILAAGVIAFPGVSRPSEEGAASIPHDSRRGLTWGVREGNELPPNVVDVNCHGGPKVDPRYAHEGSCNPYQGDTSCTARLPLLCFKPDGSAPPAGGVRQNFNDGWASGRVALTAPLRGTSLTNVETADAFCRRTFGTDWRMAEFHDGKGGWGFVARGQISRVSRFWVRINDQPGNCWDSRNDAAGQTAASVAPGTPRPSVPSRMTDSEVRDRVIERRLAEAKPAAPPPLPDANQALRQALTAQAARMEERTNEWASAIRANPPKDPREAAAAKEGLSQLVPLNAKIRQALASAHIAQLARCGTIQEAGNAALLCDSQVDLVNTCGQPKRVRDLLVFQQEGGAWIAGDSTEIMAKAVQDCSKGQ